MCYMKGNALFCECSERTFVLNCNLNRLILYEDFNDDDVRCRLRYDGCCPK